MSAAGEEGATENAITAAFGIGQAVVERHALSLRFKCENLIGVILNGAAVQAK
jgi:hypothetical protein